MVKNSIMACLPFGKRVLRTAFGLLQPLFESRRRSSDVQDGRGTCWASFDGSNVHPKLGWRNGPIVLAALCFILLSLPAFGQVPVQVGPEPQTQFLSMTGEPLAGGIVCTYEAGTSTPQATYTDSTGSTPNANPVVLDSSGRANIWWQAPAYKVVLAAGGTCASPSGLQWTVDNFSVGVFAAGNTTFSGNNTFNGTSTFNGAVNITNGGSFNGTFTGNPTFSGTVTFSGSLSVSQLQLTVATGTPPLVVTSTTVVPNLNVEVINGVAYPASPSLHSVPVITALNVATYKVIPDCPAEALQFTQSTNTFACNGPAPGAVDCPASKAGYALTFTAGTWSCTEIIPPVFKKGTNGGTYDSASGSLVDVDTTNLKYVVTIPTGSSLVIHASGVVGIPSSGGSVATDIALADGGSLLVDSLTTQPTSGANVPFSLLYVVAGDGLSHSITLQFAKHSGSNGDAQIQNSSGVFPTMLFTLQ
jgi:hypothetical protein